MSIKNLSALTWEEVRDVAGPRVVAILAVGATEAHGPHLPLSTDVVIGEAMARAGAALLASDGYDVVLLPPLAFSPAPFAAGFAGTLSLRESTLTALVVDVARSLASHGLRTLAIANAHLDPAHLRALHAAEAELAGECRVAFPDLTRRPWGGRLTDEFRSGACHAGRFESSVVMAESPELVRDELRARLDAVDVSLSKAIGAGKRTFEEAGADRAYCGAPADATAEEGRRTIDALGGILRDAVVAALEESTGEAT